MSMKTDTATGPPALRRLFTSHLLAFLLTCPPSPLSGQGETDVVISTEKSDRSLVLVSGDLCASLCVSPGEWPGVKRALADLQNDLGRVTGTVPGMITATKAPRSEFVI